MGARVVGADTLFSTPVVEQVILIFEMSAAAVLLFRFAAGLPGWPSAARAESLIVAMGAGVFTPAAGDQRPPGRRNGSTGKMTVACASCGSANAAHDKGYAEVLVPGTIRPGDPVRHGA